MAGLCKGGNEPPGSLKANLLLLLLGLLLLLLLLLLLMNTPEFTDYPLIETRFF